MSANNSLLFYGKKIQICSKHNDKVQELWSLSPEVMEFELETNRV